MFIITRVIKEIGRPRSASLICLFTSMITDRTGRHEVFSWYLKLLIFKIKTLNIPRVFSPEVKKQNQVCAHDGAHFPIDRFHMTSRRPYLCKKQWLGGHVCVQKNPVGIELFSHVKAFFYSKQFAELLTTWLKTIYRDLTIRQRRRPRKDQWKIDSASFQTISRFSEVVLLRRGFRLELKRGGSARVQTEMVEFIALPFSSSKKKLKFGHFTS